MTEYCEYWCPPNVTIAELYRLHATSYSCKVWDSSIQSAARAAWDKWKICGWLSSIHSTSTCNLYPISLITFLNRPFNKLKIADVLRQCQDPRNFSSCIIFPFPSKPSHPAQQGARPSGYFPTMNISLQTTNYPCPHKMLMRPMKGFMGIMNSCHGCSNFFNFLNSQLQAAWTVLARAVRPTADSPCHWQSWGRRNTI